LGVAVSVLKRYNLKIPVISLAKREEKIFVEWSEEGIILPISSPELQLLQRIRDEAHRFAISYHRKIRSKNFKFSFLDEIKGIGEKTKKRIIMNFPDVNLIANLNVVQLKQIGINEKIAEKIIEKAREVISNEK